MIESVRVEIRLARGGDHVNLADDGAAEMIFDLVERPHGNLIRIAVQNQVRDDAKFVELNDPLPQPLHASILPPAKEQALGRVLEAFGAGPKVEELADGDFMPAVVVAGVGADTTTDDEMGARHGLLQLHCPIDSRFDPCFEEFAGFGGKVGSRPAALEVERARGRAGAKIEFVEGAFAEKGNETLVGDFAIGFVRDADRGSTPPAHRPKDHHEQIPHKDVGGAFHGDVEEGHYETGNGKDAREDAEEGCHFWSRERRAGPT